MSAYRFSHADPATGMSSFKRVTDDSPPEPEQFQVRCTFLGGSYLDEGALTGPEADARANLMNQASHGTRHYTVEPLTQVDYTPWHEFNRNFKYPGPAAIKIRYEDGEPVFDGFVEEE